MLLTIHTHTLTITHTYIHHSLTVTQVCTHWLTHTPIHRHTRTHSSMPSTPLHTQSHVHTYTHTHMLTITLIPHSPTYAHTFTHTHTYIYSPAHTVTYSRAHTYKTHLHTRSSTQSSSAFTGFAHSASHKVLLELRFHPLLKAHDWALSPNSVPCFQIWNKTGDGLSLPRVSH